jgi:hypothetical protein
MNKILFSHKSDDWATPKDLLIKIKEEFGELYDPCPLHAEHDALKMAWLDRCFVNPPYSRIKDFVAWGTQQLNYDTKLIVWLLPARVDTRWFHEYFYNKVGVEIRFIKGRLKFGGGNIARLFQVC